MPTLIEHTLAPLSSLIQRENRHGGIAVLHVQAGVPAERRASLLVEALESMPDDGVGKVLLAFSPGTELCCTSLWAMSHLSDRCTEAGGSLVVSGLGDSTLEAARQTGLCKRFAVVDDVEEGVARLLSKANSTGRPGLRRLFGRAA